MDAATISKQIRALGGITRKELALLADISPSTVTRIEQGALDPTWGTLTRILEATGSQIYGDTVSSSGDTTAIAAARPIMASLFDMVLPSFQVLFEQAPDDTSRTWLTRWHRAGWLSERPSADDMVNIAVAAGNAGKIGRRRSIRRSVSAPAGWQDLARTLDSHDIPYAVSGYTAARPDRGTTPSVNPVLYVRDPALLQDRLGLANGTPGNSALLISPNDDELQKSETASGFRFANRSQGLLDAFAGLGREPDKAESTLRSLVGAAQ